MRRNVSNGNELTVRHGVGLATVFLLIGLAVVVGAGCGGGGGDSGETPIEYSYLEITSANALEVSGAVIETLAGSLELADAGGGAFPDGAADQAPGLAAPAAVGPIEESCLVDGSVTLSGKVADPDRLSVGDRITAVFDDCDDGFGFVTDGRVDFTIRALQGDPLTEVFLVRLDVELVHFVVTEDGESTRADGGFKLTLDSLDFPQTVTRLVGDSLKIAAGGDTMTLAAFDQTVETDLSLLPYLQIVTATGTLASELLAGKVDYQTVAPVSGPAGDAPDAGQLLITGLDNATIRVVVLGPSSVELRIDLDGNGSVDDVQTTTWAELGGTVAPGVTAGNAVALVREAFAAASQYELAVRDAGAQFGSEGAFWNALSLIAAPGTFGPVMPRCQLSSGSATVSGQLGVLDTFTAGDQFNGRFVECYQGTPPGQFPIGSIIVEGELATVVLDYSGSALSFDVDFEGNLTGFEGAIGPLSGSYGFVPVGITYSGSSPEVQLESLSGARALVDARVDQSSSSLSNPPRITRDLDGALFTALIPGRYVYETLTPFELDADSDPATGPDRGEMRLTADNGSAVYVLAVSEFEARLDLDLDGNGSIDQSVLVPWLELQP